MLLLNAGWPPNVGRFLVKIFKLLEKIQEFVPQVLKQVVNLSCCICSLVFSVCDGKDGKHQKSWFQPANGLQITCLLFEIHNILQLGQSNFFNFSYFLGLFIFVYSLRLIKNIYFFTKYILNKHGPVLKIEVQIYCLIIHGMLCHSLGGAVIFISL